MMIKRTNGAGQTYKIERDIVNDYERVRVSVADKSMLMNATLDEISSGWYKWQMRGMKVQEAFPFLNDNEREFILTGITEEEWNKLFPKE